jgi:hypothetical protein
MIKPMYKRTCGEINLFHICEFFTRIQLNEPELLPHLCLIFCELIQYFLL